MSYIFLTVSLQENATPWAAANVTNNFLDGLDKDCVVDSDNNIYVQEGKSCPVKVSFLSNDTHELKRDDAIVFVKNADR